MSLGRRLRVIWDDPPTSVSGTLVAWVDDPGRPGARSPLVELERSLSAEEGDRAIQTGRFLMLSARYSGHDWDSEEGVVHATLFPTDPRLHATKGVWVADHAVYRSISDASD